MEFRAAIMAAATVLAACGCSREGPSPPDSAGKIQVVATIFPIADVARQVGGSRVEVHCLLDSGQEPHRFSPKMRQIELLAKARLVVTIGMGIDAWADQALQRARKGKIEVLELASSKEFRELPEDPSDSDDHGHYEDAGARHHHAGDPHVWLDPVFMQAFVASIARELSRIDPEHAGQYSERAAAYTAELGKLDEEYRTVLGGVARRHFVTIHPAFTYVARRYGLVAMSLYNTDMAGFGPKKHEQIDAFVRRHNVRAIFAEPQLANETVQRLAEKTGVRVRTLDPMGNPNVKGYDTYLAMMRSNLRALESALR